jgi:signal transduction histidine kinase
MGVLIRRGSSAMAPSSDYQLRQAIVPTMRDEVRHPRPTRGSSVPTRLRFVECATAAGLSALAAISAAFAPPRWLVRAWRGREETELRSAEMRRLDEARREFVANAAHELRTPLTAIVGLSSTLAANRARLSEDKLAAGLEALERQARRMRALVSDLLDLTQVEKGELDLDLQPVDVRAAARQVLEVIPPPEGTLVETSIEDDLRVVADPARLDQVLSNLLANAYRHGGRQVRIEAADQDDGVVMAVSDDGAGIPSELQTRVFDPFAKGPGPRREEGTGLGLAIVQRVAEAIGGRVSYESMRPRGSRFLVHLRRAG